ncbi:11672_t:CDS:1, partial [Racocetra persica]
ADENKSRDTLISYIQNSLNPDQQRLVKIVYVNNDMSLKNKQSHNPGTELGALIDMKLLSLCDDLILTFGSTFGFVAAGWSYRSFRRLRGPLVVMPTNTTDDFSFHKIWFWQAGSNEPCMYLSKLLLKDSDPETVKVFKTNPFWMYYSQGCP